MDKNVIKCPNCSKDNIVRKITKGVFRVYFCKSCHNGFTYPTPKNIGKYYQNYYWESSSLIGSIKNYIFDIFQARRVNWVKKTIPKGLILDVGSGEGRFGSALPHKFKVVNIEPPRSKIKNKSVLKLDFLTWPTKQKFDAICFWESLEHTDSPQLHLSKAYKLLKDGGYIFIEFPRYNCLESKIFAKNWFHLDLPRHLSHLTDKGINCLLSRCGFRDITQKSVASFDYAPWGFIASTLNMVNPHSTDYVKKTGSKILAIFLLPLWFISLIIEIALFTIKQSPIGLAIGKK
jgi:SAM-dependent methyltransferase